MFDSVNRVYPAVSDVYITSGYKLFQIAASNLEEASTEGRQ